MVLTANLVGTSLQALSLSIKACLNLFRVRPNYSLILSN
jgi:hypothetical protein